MRSYFLTPSLPSVDVEIGFTGGGVDSAVVDGSDGCTATADGSGELGDDSGGLSTSMPPPPYDVTERANAAYRVRACILVEIHCPASPHALPAHRY